MKFFFVLFLVCIQKNNLIILLNNSNTFEKNKNSYKYNGCDHRNLTNENEEKIKLYKIHKLFQTKKILDVLKNENVSFVTKLLLLQDNRIKSSNIFAGGLMKDFDFEF
jgi:hypothetical protein